MFIVLLHSGDWQGYVIEPLFMLMLFSKLTAAHDYKMTGYKPTKSKSIAGISPCINTLSALAEPQACVQPRVP